MKRTLAFVLLAVMLLSAFTAIPVSAASVNNAFTNQNNQDGYVKGGSLVESDLYTATDFIAGEAGDIVYVGAMYSKHDAKIPVIECYDSSKKYIDDVYVKDLASTENVDLSRAVVSAVLPIGTAYFKVNVNIFMAVDLVVTVNEKFDAKTYCEQIGESAPYELRYDSPLFGKSAMFLGDSIVSGLCENSTTTYPSDIRSWGGRIGTFNAMNFKNKGIDGWTIGQTSWGEGVMIYNQFKDEKDEFDFVVLEGGVNDLWAEGKIGEISAADNFTTFDKTTYAGALEWYFSEMKKKFPSAIICYIMVYDTKYATAGSWMVKDKASLDKLWAEGKKICEKWDIPYFDMYNSEKIAELLHQDESKRTEYLYDGVHPTFKGYEAIYPEIQAWMEDLIEAKYPNGVPSSTEVKDPTFKIAPSRYGSMENWANSPNKGTAANVYQVLTEPQKDGSPVSTLISTSNTWIMTFKGSDGSEKTITIKPATAPYGFLVRFETVLQDAANQFIPKAGVKYTIEAKVMDKFGNIWTGSSSNNAFTCPTGFEATVPAEYNYSFDGINIVEKELTVGLTKTILEYNLSNGLNASDIVWTSSDTSIATVENGVVKTIKAGTVTITAKIGKYSDTIKITADSLSNVTAGKPIVLGWNKTESLILSDGKTDAYECNGIPIPYDPATSNTYFEMDLGASLDISHIKVVGNQGWTKWYKWEAYASNNKDAAISEWTKIAEKTNEVDSQAEYKAGTVYNVDGTEKYRYVRVYGVDINETSYHMIHLSEIEVWAMNDQYTEPAVSSKPITSGLPITLGWNGSKTQMLTNGIVSTEHECQTIPTPYDVKTSTTYFEIDLQAEYNVDYMIVYAYPSSTWWYKWEAYATDDNTKPITEWTKVAEKTNTVTSAVENAAKQKYYVEGNTAYRYIRIYGVDINETSYHMIHLTEVEVYGSPVTHTYGNFKVTTNPTCTESGVKTGTCADCGKTGTFSVPANGHTLAKQADGSVKCTVCKETIFKADACSKGHTPVTIPAVAPTCTENGSTEGTECSVCGEYIKAPEVAPATGHTPVTNADGSVSCSVCKELLERSPEDGEPIEILPWNNGWENWTDNNGQTQLLIVIPIAHEEKNMNYDWTITLLNDQGSKTFTMKPTSKYVMSADRTLYRFEVCIADVFIPVAGESYEVSAIIKEGDKVLYEATGSEGSKWSVLSGFKPVVPDGSVTTPGVNEGEFPNTETPDEKPTPTPTPDVTPTPDTTPTPTPDAPVTPGVTTPVTPDATPDEKPVVTPDGTTAAPTVTPESTDEKNDEKGGDNTALIIIIVIAVVVAAGGAAAFFIIKKKKA